MSVVITAVRAVMVLASLLGWVHTVSKRLRPELALGAVFASIGSAMFLAGILNVLPHAAWAICAGGVYLLARAVWKRESFRPLLCPGIVFFLACAAVLPLALYGCTFVQPDNYTHWGLALQKLLLDDRFPIQGGEAYYDKYFYFPSYPLGSTSFVYCFACLLGVHAEWAAVYIQNLLIAGSLTALFVFVRRWYAVAAAALLAVCMTAADTSMDQQLLYSLLVDILLPAVALSAIAMCVCCQERLADMLWWTAPYTVFLMSIKNSGIFFSAVVLLYALAVMGQRRRRLGRWLGCALCPAAALLLWQRHVRLVFPDGLTTRHSMTLEHFHQILDGKTPEDVRAILGHFCDTVFSASNQMLYILAALVLVYLFRRFLLRSGQRPFRQLAALVLASYAAYMAALAGTYLLSMELDEALSLAGFDRYALTILIFESGVVFIAAGSAVEELPARQSHGPAAALCAAMAAMGLLCLTPNPQYLHGQDASGSPRSQMDAILAANSIPTGQSYLVLTPGDGFRVVFHDEIFNYLLRPQFFTFQSVDFMTGKDFLLSNYNYLIVLEQTDACRAYMEQTFGDADLQVVQLDYDPT